MNINDIFNHLLEHWKGIISTSFVSAIILIFRKKLEELIDDIKLSDVFIKIMDIFSTLSKTKEWRRDYLDDKLDLFRSYTSENEMRLYVPTRFQEERPNMDEMQEQGEIHSAHKELIPYFLDTIFVQNNPNRFYCVLAETGMGKTTFLVQLLSAYINKYNEKSLPFEIFILPLADINVIDKINNLPESSSKRKSILLLDALDENKNAYDRKDEYGEKISSYEDFRKELEIAVERFQFTVITCRTQFFTDERAELKKYKYGKNKQSTPDKSLPNYKMLYISPFSKDDIDEFIEKKFKHDKNSKKAKDIISNIKYVAVRPLILSYIDDLMDGKIENVLDAYEIIIDKWLQREVNHILDEDEIIKQKGLLYDFSRKLAVYLYENWSKSGVLYLTQKEYEEFENKYECNNPNFNRFDFNYETKSLIARDSLHNIIFSHKSFIEYFCAEQLFLGEISDFNFAEMNMAKTFFELFCQNKENKLEILGESDVDKARRYDNIGSVYYKSMGDFAKALEYYRGSLAIRKKVFGNIHFSTAYSYNNIGLLYEAKGNYGKALEYYKESLAIREIVFGLDHPDTKQLYHNIGDLYAEIGNDEKALEYYGKPLAISEIAHDDDYLDNASLYLKLGQKSFSKFNYDNAVKYLMKAFAIYEKKLGKTHPNTKFVCDNIGYVYNLEGKTKEALKWFDKAKE